MSKPEPDRIELTLDKPCPYKMGNAFGIRVCTKDCAFYIEREVKQFDVDENGVMLHDAGGPVVTSKLYCGCVLVHNERENNDAASSLNALAQVLCKAFEKMNVTAEPGRVTEREAPPAHLNQAE